MQTIEKYVDVLTEQDLRELAGEHESPCLSLYMPTERMGRETEQNPIRFKNLLDDAAAKLKTSGLNSERRNALLAKIEPTADAQSREFWRYQSEGLAIFVAPDVYAPYRLPHQFDAQAYVGNAFYIIPLLPMVSDNERFYILTLDKGDVRLLQCGRYRIGEIDMDDAPSTLAEVLQYDEFERQVQLHTSTDTSSASGNRDAMYHGHGTVADNAVTTENILRFFRALDNGICELLVSRQAPLVLAGPDHLRGLYRQANHYEHLVASDIDAAPESLDDESLHRQAWAIVEPHFERAQRKAIDQYQHFAGSEDERAANSLNLIVPAAHYERVDTLFVAAGHRQWGAFDPKTGQVRLPDEPQPGDYDLLNDAAIHTILNGGAVYVVAPESMPGRGPLAAILRY